MVKSDQGDDEGFTSRWSRRKRETQTGEPAAALDQVAGTEGAPAADLPADPGDSEVPALPDPDTLNIEADFTVFLKDGVPEALRRRALRRLWRLNPVFANLDGLNDYDEDYTDAATVVEGLKTLYKVGKGFVMEQDEKPQEAAPDADEPAAETPDEEDNGPDEPGGTAEIAAQGAVHAPPPAAKEAEEVTVSGAIAVSGPGNRRLGALARRWGQGDG